MPKPRPILATCRPMCPVPTRPRTRPRRSTRSYPVERVATSSRSGQAASSSSPTREPTNTLRTFTPGPSPAGGGAPRTGSGVLDSSALTPAASRASRRRADSSASASAANTVRGIGCPWSRVLGPAQTTRRSALQPGGARCYAAAVEQGRARDERLLEAGLILSSELSLPLTLQRIVELAAEITGARYGALGVLGADGTITAFITTGVSEAERAAIGHIPVGRGILGVLIQ